MDNFKLDVQSEGEDQLYQALRIAFDRLHYDVKAVGYTLSEEYGLVFHKYHYNVPEKMGTWNELPFKADAKFCAIMAWNWLQTLSQDDKFAKLPRTQSFDGSTAPGWRVYTDDWGQINGCPSAFVGVLYKIALYGK